MDGTGRATTAAATLEGDAQAAITHALKVGASLLCTWGIALGVRFALPRYLGPEAYGGYAFADAFALTFFVFATLGIDTYVQRELPLRPHHASDFFGGLVVLRATVGAALLLVMWAVLVATGRPPWVQALALFFGLGQLFFVQNQSFVAMLNARGTVNGMAIVNVVTKCAWGAAVLLSVIARWPLWTLGAAFLLGEAVRTAALFVLCQRHLGLRTLVDAPALRGVLRRCLPFFFTTLALTLYGRLDVTILSYVANDMEVGWYAAASMVSSLGLLLAPLITGVLLPLFARAKARGEEELYALVRRSMELILSLCAPVMLMLFLCADLWIYLASGRGFEPAAMALRTIAPIFALTYLAMLCASVLNLLGREWTVTKICLMGLAINPLLNVTLIPWMMEKLGRGGGGVGAALSIVLTEAAIVSVMLFLIGRRTMDKRLLSVVARTALVCAAVFAVHDLSANLGYLRVLIDAVAYVALALVFRVVNIDEARALWRSRREARA